MAKASKARPKAYSYLRFSTPEQMHGHSFERQLEMARKYADDHDLDLDLDKEGYADLGVSAYRGKNVEEGALRTFLNAVEAGDVPRGSFLLVENLDRLSRAAPRRVIRLIEEICEAGVTVVTLSDGRSYTEENLDSDVTYLFQILIIAARAHEESVMKGRRVRAAWDAKRERAHEEPLTARAPAWLTLDRSTSPPKWKPIRERVQVVRDIYRMAARGMGQHAIAADLNERKVPTFGRSEVWHRSYVKKILESKAVVGTYEPHVTEHDADQKKTRRKVGSVEGYYPAAVSAALYEKVHSFAAPARTRPGKSGRPTPVHIFAGLARCGLCGGAMTRVYKGKRGGKPKLVCTKAKTKAGCKYLTVDVETLEGRFREEIEQLVAHAPSGRADLDSALARAMAAYEATREQIENLVSEIASGSKSDALRERLMALEAALQETEAEKDRLEDQVSKQSRRVVTANLERLVEATESGSPAPVVNAALRLVLRAAILHPMNATLELEWQHSEQVSTLLYAWPKPT